MKFRIDLYSNKDGGTFLRSCDELQETWAAAEDVASICVHYDLADYCEIVEIDD